MATTTAVTLGQPRFEAPPAGVTQSTHAAVTWLLTRDPDAFNHLVRVCFKALMDKKGNKLCAPADEFREHYSVTGRKYDNERKQFVSVGGSITRRENTDYRRTEGMGSELAA